MDVNVFLYSELNKSHCLNFLIDVSHKNYLIQSHWLQYLKYYIHFDRVRNSSTVECNITVMLIHISYVLL